MSFLLHWIWHLFLIFKKKLIFTNIIKANFACPNWWNTCRKISLSTTKKSIVTHTRPPIVQLKYFREKKKLQFFIGNSITIWTRKWWWLWHQWPKGKSWTEFAKRQIVRQTEGKIYVWEWVGRLGYAIFI